MRRVTILMQTSLDLRIATGTGQFWEPFAWGTAEAAHVNEIFETADTWAMSRVVYEAVVPWWEAVAAGAGAQDAGEPTAEDHEFARILSGMTKLVFSRTLAPAAGRPVVGGDLVAALWERKNEPGRTILLSCGPSTLAPLVGSPGLVDGCVLVLHPAVPAGGPRLFADLDVDLALRTTRVQAFPAGAVALHYDLTIA